MRVLLVKVKRTELDLNERQRMTLLVDRIPLVRRSFCRNNVDECFGIFTDLGVVDPTQKGAVGNAHRETKGPVK